MLGDFITRCLVLLLGYAYPAFECYKTVEKNRVEIEELRFWCQYWVVVALLTVLERIGDIFISWLPMYGEVKLAFIIYLWYPKTKGTGYIYDTLLRPLLAKHETDIDRKIFELRARLWDFAIYYWENCTKLGQTTFFQILQYMVSQSSKFTNSGNQKKSYDRYTSPPPDSPSFHHSNKAKRWPPSAPSAPPSPRTTINRSTSEPSKSETIKIYPHRHTESIQIGDMSIPESDGALDSPYTPTDPHASDKLYQARMRLRRSKPIQN